MNSVTQLRLSFIIPVLNGERFIGRCLEHLRQEAGGDDEIIVVDNGSSDRTLEIVRDAGDTVLIEAPGVTIAALRNRGAAIARNEILAFIDADCLLCPGWRAAVERILADPAVSATGSFYDVPEQSTWVERAWWSFRPRNEHRTSFLISGNFIVRKSAFQAVGGFNESLVTDEDTDISRRLAAAGAPMVEAPLVRVVHLGNAKTLRQFYRKEKWHATSILATMRAHQVDRPMLLTFLFIITCGLAVLVPLWLHGYRAAMVMLLLILAAPGVTAAYKVVRHRNYGYFLHLLPLYLIVYLARSLVLLQGLFRRAGQRP
jgi:glycosyltransferase involved in cell wall biosynthesis